MRKYGNEPILVIVNPRIRITHNPIDFKILLPVFPLSRHWTPTMCRVGLPRMRTIPRIHQFITCNGGVNHAVRFRGVGVQFYSFFHRFLSRYQALGAPRRSVINLGVRSASRPPANHIFTSNPSLLSTFAVPLQKPDPFLHHVQITHYYLM